MSPSSSIEALRVPPTPLLDLPEFDVHVLVHVAGEPDVIMARPRNRQACTRSGLIDPTSRTAATSTG